MTGAAQGIGQAIAARFLAAGHRVALLDVQVDALEQARSELDPPGSRTLAVVADLADPAAIRAAVATVEATFGGVDVLVSNAAYAVYKPFADHSVEEWDRTFAVNTRAAQLLSAAVVPLMCAGGGGSIVFVSSVAAVGFTGRHLAYTASKAALLGLTRDLAFEVGADGVRVNAVMPGPISTPLLLSKVPAQRIAMYERLVALRRLGRPDEVAEAVYFLASDAASFITGAVLPVSGGVDARIYPD